jgi:hypothetical protein
MKNENCTFILYLTMSAVTLLEGEYMCIILWMKGERNYAALFIEHLTICSLPIVI